MRPYHRTGPIGRCRATLRPARPTPPLRPSRTPDGCCGCAASERAPYALQPFIEIVLELVDRGDALSVQLHFVEISPAQMDVFEVIDAMVSASASSLADDPLDIEQ